MPKSKTEVLSFDRNSPTPKKVQEVEKETPKVTRTYEIVGANRVLTCTKYEIGQKDLSVMRLSPFSERSGDVGITSSHCIVNMDWFGCYITRYLETGELPLIFSVEDIESLNETDSTLYASILAKSALGKTLRTLADLSLVPSNIRKHIKKSDIPTNVKQSIFLSVAMEGLDKVTSTGTTEEGFITLTKQTVKDKLVMSNMLRSKMSIYARNSVPFIVDLIDSAYVPKTIIRDLYDNIRKDIRYEVKYLEDVNGFGEALLISRPNKAKSDRILLGEYKNVASKNPLDLITSLESFEVVKKECDTIISLVSHLENAKDSSIVYEVSQTNQLKSVKQSDWVDAVKSKHPIIGDRMNRDIRNSSLLNEVMGRDYPNIGIMDFIRDLVELQSWTFELSTTNSRRCAFQDFDNLSPVNYEYQLNRLKANSRLHRLGDGFFELKSSLTPNLRRLMDVIAYLDDSTLTNPDMLRILLDKYIGGDKNLKLVELGIKAVEKFNKEVKRWIASLSLLILESDLVEGEMSTKSFSSICEIAQSLRSENIKKIQEMESYISTSTLSVFEPKDLEGDDSDW